ncbi:MAG: hypothetical protein AB3N18_13295, partial [Allomuricauda sp.]
MARIRLILDTRKSSKSTNSGLFPIAIRVFHKRQRHIRLPYYTSIKGWDNSNLKLRKSALANKNQNCDYVNKVIFERLHIAKKLIHDLGDTLHTISVDVLVEHIKIAWTETEDSTIKRKITNTLTLEEW